MEDRVGNPAEISNGAVVIYLGTAGVKACLQTLSLASLRLGGWFDRICWTSFTWFDKASRVALFEQACIH